MVRNKEPSSGGADFFDGAYGQVFFYGPSNTPIGGEPIYAALTPQEAWNIDTKMDDGKPACGRVLTYKGGTSTSYLSSVKDCATTDVSTTAAYNLANDSIGCALVFLWRN